MYSFNALNSSKNINSQPLSMTQSPLVIADYVTDKP